MRSDGRMRYGKRKAGGRKAGGKGLEPDEYNTAGKEEG